MESLKQVKEGLTARSAVVEHFLAVHQEEPHRFLFQSLLHQERDHDSKRVFQ
jgi:hypothetical protein